MTVKRQMDLNKHIAAISEKVKLSNADQEVCQEQGKQLLKTWSRSAHLLAASLVFVACRKHRPCMSHKELSDHTNVKVKMLAKCVKKTTMELKKLSVVEEEEKDVFEQTDENIRTELEQMMGRLDVKKNQNEVIANALDLLVLLRENVKAVLTSPTYLCAVTMFVIKQQTGRLICNADINQFAKKLGIKSATLRQRILHIRKGLLSLAEKIPTLEDQVTSRDVTVANVENYIDTILKYRWLLTKPRDQHTSSSDEVEATPTSCPGGSGSVSLVLEKWVPPDDVLLEEDTLDIDEYINTEDEVKAKEQLYKDVSPTPRRPKKRSRPPKRTTCNTTSSGQQKP